VVKTKFVLAEDEAYYNHDKIVSLYKEKYNDYEVLFARFVGVPNLVRLCTSTHVPGGIGAYLIEHELEMWG
jgi:hypothetical protein